MCRVLQTIGSVRGRPCVHVFEVIRAVLNGRSMSAASLALHVSKTPMLYVLGLVRACLPAICIAYAPGLVSMHIMLSLCRCRGRCVAVTVAVAVADVHCTAASTLPLCMAVMFCTLSCMSLELRPTDVNLALFTGGLPIPLMFGSQLPSCLQGLWRVLKNTVPDGPSLAAAMLLPVPSLQSQ